MTPSRAVVFHGPGQALEVRAFDLADPGPGEILVRVLGATLCGSDLHTYHGRRSTPLPTVLGHEIAGEIVAFGEAAPERDVDGTPLRIGDRVTWSVVASCGACFHCIRDLPQKCLHQVKYGHEAIRPGVAWVGGLAGHCVLAPGTALVKLPETLSLEAACPANCATATAAAAMAAAGQVTDRHVCIFGLGLLGLTAAAMARSAGAATVACVDVDEARRARAAAFGATHAIEDYDLPDVIESACDGKGFDVAIDMAGAPAVFEPALASLCTGGVFVLVGSAFPVPAAAVNPEDLVRRHLTLRGIHNYRPRDLAAAVRFLDTGGAGYPFDSLVSQWFPLEAAEAAFSAAADRATIRVGVRPA